MYANPTTTYMMRNSLPSPEYTGDSDSDSDIIHELEEKRRQFDEEIARFKAQKDKEFKDFETALKSRRKHRRDMQQSSNSNNKFLTDNSPSATPPGRQSMLTGCEKTTRKHTRHNSRHSEPICLIKPNSSPKVTHPTLALEKLNISGANMHQAPHVTTPPTSTTAPQLSPRPKPASAQQRTCTSKTKGTTSHLVKKQNLDTVKGLFAAGFLPLTDLSMRLELAPSDNATEIHTEPASPNEEYVQESMLRSSSLPSEVSMSPGFPVSQTKRAYTAPSGVSRAALPPIIRNVNGRSTYGRKRKHVTFQLADRAIVEPSSSYEEGRSPSFDSEKDGQSDSDSQVQHKKHDHHQQPPTPQIKKRAPRDQFGRKRADTSGITTPPEEIGMGMGDLHMNEEDDDSSPKSKPPHASQTSAESDGYFTRTPNVTHKRKSSSNAIPSYFEYKTSYDSYQSPSSPPNKNLSNSYTSHANPRTTFYHRDSYPGALPEHTIDTQSSSNVGFFELDEELASPDASTPKPFQEHVEDIDDASVPSSNDTSRRGSEISSGLTRELGLGLDIGMGTSNTPTKASDTIPTGTSVPIDIVRPPTGGIPGSWVETFGH